MARLIAILLASLSTGLLAAAEPLQVLPEDIAALMAQPDPIPSALREIARQPVKDDLSSLAAHETDVVYGRKYGMGLMMETFIPKSGRKEAGVIVIVSGGFWSGPEAMHAFAWSGIRGLLEKGYVVFAVMHSSMPKYSYLEAKDDIRRAIRFVRHNSNRWGIRPDGIGIMGWSSGGLLASLAATTAIAGDPKAEDPVEREPSTVQAAVVYYGGSDLLNFGAPNRTAPQHFATFSREFDSSFDFHRWDPQHHLFVRLSEPEKRVVLRELSPLQHVTKDAAPTLLFHGEIDAVNPVQQSELFARQMEQMGAECKLIVANGKGHGWDPPLPNEGKEIETWLDGHLLQKPHKAR